MYLNIARCIKRHETISMRLSSFLSKTSIALFSFCMLFGANSISADTGIVVTVAPNANVGATKDNFYYNGETYTDKIPCYFFEEGLYDYTQTADSLGFYRAERQGLYFYVYDLHYLFAPSTNGIIDSFISKGCTYRQESGTNGCNVSTAKTGLIPLFWGNQKDITEKFGCFKLAPVGKDADGNPIYRKISRIEVQAFNASNTYVRNLVVNGKTAELPKSADYTWLAFDFEGDEQLMNAIRIEEKDKGPFGFKSIRLYVEADEEILNPEAFELKREYREDGQYTFPGPYYPELSTATKKPIVDLYIINRDTQEIEDVTCSHDEDTNVFTVRKTKNSDAPLAVGKYEAIYNLYPEEVKNDKYTPVPGHGIKFEIVQNVNYSTIYINGRSLDETQELGVNSLWVEGEGGRGMENAELTGIEDDVTVYWKAVLENELPELPANIIRKEVALEAYESVDAYSAENDIPEGYQKYDPELGLNLLHTDTLYLILEKNGARTAPQRIQYTGVQYPTSITELAADENAETRYYSLTGIKADYEAVAPGTILIKVHGNSVSKIIK